MASSDATAYIYENVGVTQTPDPGNARAYIYENVGVTQTPDPGNAQAYIYEGDVNTNTPSPYVYMLVPVSGRPGDGFQIIGHGFGASQATYSGLAQAWRDDTASWENLAVTGWARVAASAHAYDALRKIDPVLGVIDPEHEVIDVSVPAWAAPPAMIVRVRTNGA